jgi:hypothetical protein
MDRNALLADLRQAESHVRAGEAVLRQQEGVLVELRARGHDARMAEILYRSFAALQDCYVANCAQIEIALVRTQKNAAVPAVKRPALS